MSVAGISSSPNCCFSFLSSTAQRICVTGSDVDFHGGCHGDDSDNDHCTNTTGESNTVNADIFHSFDKSDDSSNDDCKDSRNDDGKDNGNDDGKDNSNDDGKDNSNDDSKENRSNDYKYNRNDGNKDDRNDDDKDDRNDDDHDENIDNDGKLSVCRYMCTH